MFSSVAHVPPFRWILWKYVSRFCIFVLTNEVTNTDENVATLAEVMIVEKD